MSDLYFQDERAVLSDLHAQLANLFGALLRFDKGARRWLWTEARTGAMERQASEVWILTPDLYWDFQDEPYRTLVRNNIVDRRARYRYLFMDTQQNRERVADLTSEYAEALGKDVPDLVQFASIPAEAFFWCTEHVLFNPFTSAECGLVVDICKERDRSRKYDVEMGRSKRNVFRSQFERLWSRYASSEIRPGVQGPA